MTDERLVEIAEGVVQTAQKSGVGDEDLLCLAVPVGLPILLPIRKQADLTVGLGGKIHAEVRRRELGRGDGAQG